MKQLQSFVAKWGIEFPYAREELIESSQNVFLASKEQRERLTQIPRDIFSIGLPLGGIRRGQFVPSFVLLDEIAARDVKKAILSEKAEWLFICGRDVFKEGVVSCNAFQGDFVIIQNTRNECLGYGRLENGARVFIKNLLDRGDFLRRERQAGRQR
ncbi:hypothetical protein HY641_04135 [Candidatus Woesearchaeota archaeon]|nr:hypothetical protein [Candidatus Woesearchaeota archaeon]